MNEYITWGGAGIVLALAGAALIASEIIHGIEAGEPLMVIYGAGVVIAALTTILIVAPSFRKDPTPVDHD